MIASQSLQFDGLNNLYAIEQKLDPPVPVSKTNFDHRYLKIDTLEYFEVNECFTLGYGSTFWKMCSCSPVNRCLVIQILRLPKAHDKIVDSLLKVIT